MTREIKFRAWHKNWGSFANLREDSDFMAGFNEEGQIYIINNGYPDEKNRDFIIQQYTGFKDKKGKEIYEGDIVRSDCYSAEMSKYFEVLFKEDGYFVSSGRMKQSLELWRIKEQYRLTEWIKHLRKCNIEIVGNIYENPELLNQ